MFTTGFQMIFSKLSSCHILGDRNSPPSKKKKLKIPKKNLFWQNRLNIFRIIQVTAFYIYEKIVMMGLVGTLRTELSYRTYLFIRLQRT